MAPRFWSPLHLQGTSESLAAAGDTSTINPRNMLNPNRGPMLIDQFRFAFKADSRGYSYPNTSFLSAITAEIALGVIPLMSKPVTLGAFVPQYVGEYSGEPPAGPLYANPGVDTTFVCHLDKPLFVPQNVQMTMRLGHQANANSPALPFDSVRVSIVGRSLPEDEPNPDRIWVPWFSETKTTTSENEFTSADSDLINSHNVPLHVKALCGVNLEGHGANTPTIGDLRIQMSASNGLAFIRDPTPFFALFPQDRNRFAVDTMLQPGQFFRCRLTNGVPGQAAVRPVGFTAVGMTGYRLVPTPKANR